MSVSFSRGCIHVLSNNELLHIYPVTSLRICRPYFLLNAKYFCANLNPKTIPLKCYSKNSYKYKGYFKNATMFQFLFENYVLVTKINRKKIEGIQIQKYVCKFSLLIQNKYEQAFYCGNDKILNQYGRNRSFRMLHENQFKQ